MIVFPFQEELAFFLTHCKDRGLRWQDAQLGHLPVHRLAKLNLTLALRGTGKAQFAVQTQHLLDADTSWQMAVCAGAEGVLSSIVYDPDRRAQIKPNTTSVVFTIYAPDGVSHEAVASHLNDIKTDILLFSPRARVLSEQVHTG